MPASSPLAAPRDLSDYDVQVLNDIVVAALKASDVDTHPQRALHRAYEDVLDDRSIPRRHDSLYLRFIFDLGKKKQNQNLYARFEELLRERGIELEKVDDEHSINTRPSRRASLGSLDNDYEDLRRLGFDRRRPESRASMSQFVEGTRPLSPGPNYQRPNGQVKDSAFNISTIAHASQTPAAKAKQKVQYDWDNATPLDFRTHQQRSDSDNVSWHPEDFRYLKNGLPQAPHNVPHQFQFGREDQARPDMTTELAWDEKKYPGLVKKHEFAVLLYRKHNLRKLYQLWKSRAYLWAYYAHQAQHIDTDESRRQSHHAWVLELRKSREQEQMAIEAWRTNLLGKAFTHWVVCSREEALKTQLAKQRLVSVRYFQAWKDLTISNEKKVRRHICGKFMRRWKSRSAEQTAWAVQVLDYRDDTLLRRTMTGWMWHSRDRYASYVDEMTNKRKALLALTTRFRMSREKESVFVEKGCRNALQVWHKRKQHVDHLTMIATHHESSHSVGDTFCVWRLQGQYVPRERDLASKLDERLMRTTFSRLLDVYEMRQRGKFLDRRRILATAWDVWNDRLRTHSLLHRINERLVAECLYKWVLAERCRLYERLRTERLLECCAERLLTARSTRSRELTNASRQVAASHNTLQKEVWLRRWIRKTRNHSRHQAAAVAKDDRRITTSMFNQLQLRYEQIQLLESQYVPSFVLFYKGKESLQIWQKARKQSQANKRHEAYVQVRRQVKMNLCRKYLSKWRYSMLEVQAVHDAGVEVYEDRLLTLGTKCFDHWKDMATDLRQRGLQVALDRDALILGRQLLTWGTRTAIMQDNTEKALEYDGEHSRRAAYRCLRKLHFRIRFIQERQAGGAYGLELRQWSQRDLARNLLRLWLERSLRQRGVPEADLPPTAKTRRFKNMLRNLPTPAPTTTNGTAQQGSHVGGISQRRQPDPSPFVVEPHGVLDPAAVGVDGLMPPTTPSRRMGRSLRTPARSQLQSRQPQPSQLHHQQQQQLTQQAVRGPSGLTGLSNNPGPQEMASVQEAAIQGSPPSLVEPATDSRVQQQQQQQQRQSRAFGRSTGFGRGVRRQLFAPIPERSSFP